MIDETGRALEAVLRLAALEERTAALKIQLERIEGQLGRLLDRLARLEGRGGRSAGTRSRREETLAAPSMEGDEPAPRPFLTTYSEE